MEDICKTHNILTTKTDGTDMFTPVKDGDSKENYI